MAHRLPRRLFFFSKNSFQRLGFSRVEAPSVISVVGCQRSGTTMLLNVLERDRRTRVYHEWDSRLFDPSLRLKQADVVSRRFQQDRSHLVVTKPLLDSQWTSEFLQTYPQAHAIWIYRHYRAVAQSNLRIFGQENGRRNLRPIVSGDGDDWRAERIAPETRETIRSLFGPRSSDEDAAALFWFARNSHFFDQQVNAHSRAFLCSYENTVEDPAGSIGAIYDGVGVSRPNLRIASGIHRNAGLGSGVRLSEAVDTVCRDLWQRLEEARRSQNPHTTGRAAIDAQGAAQPV